MANTSTSDNAPGTDVVVSIPRFDDVALTNIDASTIGAFWDSLGIVPDNIDNYGTGFVVVDKKELVNVPLMLIEWVENKSSKHEGNMLTVFALTRDNRKVIFNDASTGIMRQLARVTAMRTENGYAPDKVNRGLIVNAGLEARTYDYEDPQTHEKSEATTYYLAS